MSLARALELCIDARRTINEGKSPVIEEQRDTRRMKDAKSSGEFGEKYLKTAVMAESTCAIFERELLPIWRKRLLTEIVRCDLRALCLAIVERGAPATAIHARDIADDTIGDAALPDGDGAQERVAGCRLGRGGFRERRLDDPCGAHEVWIGVQTAFAADVAHELRTPLAVIRLHADGVGDPNIRAAILTSVDRAARVIGQFPALADLERPIESSGRTVDLHALAEHVVSDRAPGIFASGRTIALQSDGAPVCPHGYPEALTLALENLVDNAARHTPPGTAIVVTSGPGPRLTVSDD